MRLDAAGIGAVVLPSLFEEQIVQEAMEVDRMLATGAEAFAEATDYFPELDDYNTGPDHYLAQVVEAKADPVRPGHRQPQRRQQRRLGALRAPAGRRRRRRGSSSTRTSWPPIPSCPRPRWRPPC